MKRGSIAVALAALTLIAVPSGASAATMIGQTVAPDNTCADDTTYIQSISPGQPYSAPFDGVITRWSFQTGATPPASLKLKVAHPTVGADLSMDAIFAAISESGVETPAANTVNTFASHVPVHTGDDIGVYLGVTAGSPQCLRIDAAYTNHYNNSDTANGSAELYSDETDQIPVSAVVERDCDADGLGDETQDSKVSGPNCPPTGKRAAALKRCKKKAQKNGWTNKKLKKCKRKAKLQPV